MRLTEDDLCSPRGLGCIRVKEGHQVVLHDILYKRTTEADKRDTYNNSKEGKPSVGLLVGRGEDLGGEGTELIEPKMTVEEQDAENTDE